MSDYQIVRRVLDKERERRKAFYRFRPIERGPAMAEIAGALAALEKLKRASEWNGLAKYWQDKFD